MLIANNRRRRNMRMNGNLYEIIALGARYVFAAVMLLIMLRAWKITIVDSRRAASLRRLAPETGVCGEFLVLRGHGRVRDGMRYPVIREGLVGSSRKADIRLRSGSVRRSHAFFELTEHGLRVRADSGAKLYNAEGRSKRELLLGDGSHLTLGQVELMLILTENVKYHPDTEIAPAPDTLFNVASADAVPAPEAFRRPAETPASDIFARPAAAPVQDIFPQSADTPAQSAYARPADEPATVILPQPEQEPGITFVSVDADTAAPAQETPSDPDRLFDVPGDDIWDAPHAPTDDLWEVQAVRRAPVKRPQTDDPYDF